MIAVLNGIAFGGGLELAATADLRVRRGACRGSACPRARIGIVPGWSGTQRLVRRAGSPRGQAPGADRRAGRCRRGAAAGPGRLWSCPTGEGMDAGAGAGRHDRRARAGRGADRQAAGQRRRGRGGVGRRSRRWPARWPRTTEDAAREWRAFRDKRPSSRAVRRAIARRPRCRDRCSTSARAMRPPAHGLQGATCRKAQGEECMLTKRILLAGAAVIGLALGAAPGRAAEEGRDHPLVDLRRRGRGAAGAARRISRRKG